MVAESGVAPEASPYERPARTGGTAVWLRVWELNPPNSVYEADQLTGAATRYGARNGSRTRPVCLEGRRATYNTLRANGRHRRN